MSRFALDSRKPLLYYARSLKFSLVSISEAYMQFAVVRTGGKQYKVREGQVLRVEKLEGEVGNSVDLSDVLLVGSDGTATVGTPNVAGASVKAEIVRPPSEDLFR